MNRVRIATTWLDGCSGCHMSFLDMDETLAAVADRIEIVYGPLVDAKEFPDGVDVTLVEGAVGNAHDREELERIRERTHILISFGDCAVTANVPAMRNQFKLQDVLKRGYVDNVSHHPAVPDAGVPKLLERVRPLHEFVAVDLFLPGCPPPSEAILLALTDLLEGRTPEVQGKTRFGA
ncbi:MAG: NADP oxidoreductase [Desulfomonile tiedjei]|nr:NADP oxidoreductase [Desulfomonile tiedjei]